MLYIVGSLAEEYVKLNEVDDEVSRQETRPMTYGSIELPGNLGLEHVTPSASDAHPRSKRNKTSFFFIFSIKYAVHM